MGGHGASSLGGAIAVQVPLEERPARRTHPEVSMTPCLKAHGVIPCTSGLSNSS